MDPPVPTRGTGRSFESMQMLDAALSSGDLHDANADWLLASLGSFDAAALLDGSLPPDSDGQADADGLSVVPDAADPDSWSNIELYTEKHQVHKVMVEGEAKEYIVSNLRRFEMSMMLLERNTRELAVNRTLRLKASLVYENSQPVKSAPGEVLLTGDTLATMVGGRVTLRLQMGRRALSVHHEKQKFRVKIEPEDPQLALAYPCLSHLSEPLKSVTKLNAKPPPLVPAGALPAGAPLAPGSMAAGDGAAPAPPTLPNYAAPAVGSSPPSRPAECAGGSGSMGGSFTGLSSVLSVPCCPLLPLGGDSLGGSRSRSHPGSMADSFNLGDLGGIAGGLGSFGRDISALAALAATEDGVLPIPSPAVAAIGAVGGGGGGAPAAASNNQDEIRSIVDQQRAQIEELARQNELILQELARYRREGGTTS